MKPTTLAHKLACYLKRKHGLPDLNLLDLRDIIEEHEQEAIAAAGIALESTQITETSEVPPNTNHISNMI